MSNNDCGCGNSNSANTSNSLGPNQVIIQQNGNGCMRTFNETVTEVAELIITADINAFPVSANCVGPVRFLRRFPDVVQECKFIVAQDICAEFDVDFNAIPSVGNTGLVCGTPREGECPPPPPDLECCLHADAQAGNVPTAFTLFGQEFTEGQANFSVNICPPGVNGNCNVPGSSFNLTLTTEEQTVNININHQEITSLTCEEGNILLTAVSDLGIGNSTLPDQTFEIEITPTSFTVTVPGDPNPIFTTTVTTAVNITACNGDD